MTDNLLLVGTCSNSVLCLHLHFERLLSRQSVIQSVCQTGLLTCQYRRSVSQFQVQKNLQSVSFMLMKRLAEIEI